jgi:predicted ribosome quality control (RQC) complex YloA/Tae2 family protein
MLDDKDITKIIKAMENVFPTKVYLSKELDKIRDDFSDLQTSVDAYAKKADTYFQEMVVLNNNYRRLEGWIQQVAEKVGIELKY